MRIAVFGKLRAGKSAVAYHIYEKLDCEIIEFSHGVQDVVNVLYPKYKGIKNRELLINVGQHMRKLDKDVWVNVVKHRILNSNRQHILVSGVRQQNEFDMLKELGFVFIQVEASENTRIERCIEAGDSFKVDTLRNPTEIVMDEWKPDYLILNEYGFKELEIATKNIMADIFGSLGVRESLFETGLKHFNERVRVSSDVD